MKTVIYLTCIVFISLSKMGEAQISLDEMLAHTNMNEDALEQLNENEIIMTDLSTDLENEISVAGVLLIHGMVQEVADIFVNNQDINFSDYIVEHQFISLADSVTKNFGQVKIQKDHEEEITKLLHVETGNTFNFALEEILQFQHLKQNIQFSNSEPYVFAERVLDVFRQILMDRFSRYTKLGLTGINPYQREDGETYPSEELRDALHETLIHKINSQFFDSILHYPTKQDQAESSFYWLKQFTDDRPNFALVHRIHPKEFSDVFVLLERQFYVNHSYNCYNFVVYLFPYQNNTIVFYLNHTYTDKIDGFGSLIAKGFAEDQLKSEIKQQLVALQEYFHQSNEIK